MKFKILAGVVVALVVVAVLVISSWSSMINMMMPADSRPGKIDYVVENVSTEEYDKIANEVSANYDLDFAHIERFKEEGILAYEGPQTCLTCHEEITINDAITGDEKTVGLMDNLTGSSHYSFYTKRHPNVYGFNGELADNFPMGKIDRPCPKPGSFAFTAWAEFAVTAHGDTLSEGCGQCHIGGQYQAPLGELMPAYNTTDDEKNAIDCLICHSAAYDMNKKQVVQDKNGLTRWAMDRSMKAAMTVTSPTSQTCLRCHQHNFGGDLYVDEADPSYMQSMENLGKEKPRIQHPGSKRGTPFSPSWDVHAAAGLNCIDCHTTEGHLIAKGTHTTTMMANDLPDVEVKCENCHTTEPHQENAEFAEYYNMHTEKIACVTCHIPSLHPDNATYRDFNTPMFEEHPGIYVYTDIKKETEPGKGIMYTWWNGDGTFLGNPIGDNPNGKNLFKFYNPTNVWPEYKDFDYDEWYERVMRPIAKNGRPSKIYGMKRFNGKQHIDLQNIGPFGGMYVPYSLPTYFATGSPEKAGAKEMEKGMMKMMYGTMFDVYLMNDFMKYMDDGTGNYITGWDPGAYDDVVSMKAGKVEARWIPQDAGLEMSHSIRREGAFTCANCHSPKGILDFAALGYTKEEIESLQVNPLD